jgi:hypothetical protein
MAAAAIAVVLVGMLAAMRTQGSRIAVWSAGAAAVVVGAGSIALPHAPGAIGQAWGAFAVAGSVLFVATGERHSRQRSDFNGSQ